MTENIEKILALQLVPGVGNFYLRRLISYMGSIESVWQSDYKHLSQIPGIQKETIQKILDKSTLPQARTILEQCHKYEIRVLSYLDEAYPFRLLELPDAPALIYFKGQGQLNASRMIAIVGTRQATRYGREVVDKLVKELKRVNTSTVSGLAYGIDIEVHRKSLDIDCPTFAVMASSLDQVYPKNHSQVANRMLDTGGWISEYPPGTKLEPHLFPVRNRIIAGMGDATIIVEASKKGGALITANLADSYGRLVFAVPGTLSSSYSEGCNQLIRDQKALIFTGIDDLIYHLNWDREITQDPSTSTFDQLSGEERHIISKLANNRTEGLSIDELAWICKIDMNRLASVLLQLEFQGFLKCLPGKKYVLSIS